MAEDAAASPHESSPRPVDSIEVDDEAKEEDTGAGTGDSGGGRAGLSKELLKEMKAICDTLSGHRVTIRGDEDYYPSSLFRRIPNKRTLPEYHTVIKEPRAISSLRSKSLTKKYTDFAEYVRDFALIVHNAQLFNRPNSGPVKDVLALKSVFEQELDRLVERGLISRRDTLFPDLGEIPDATPEPDPATDEDGDGEEGEGDDEEEDDDEADDSDDERKRKRGPRRTGRASMAGRKRERSDDGQRGGDGDGRKKRGRPPRVDTPMEARIKAVLKGIRKFRSDAGHLKVLAFERLPEKAQNPDYYLEIKEPIAIDQIKRKGKRKKYQSLEHFMRDLELMFSNAMQYNEDESDLYKDAKDLWEEAKKIAEVEKQKPDTEYLMEDGRLPLPNGILHNGELWKVGDWVHIHNPNDVTKPIVAQIYRTWQDTEDQQWVNACWYYRPEQTVHQYEKHFYSNEVVKTGQYRDHHVDEIIDRCFVMFTTRFSRGRPRDLDPSKEVYVCEARYNEERHRLNKIKTWASCLPDEVRDRDYEMDLFGASRRIKKYPSPIKHLLKPGAKPTDEPPPPQWGHDKAPPIVGAVHCQPRDENQSPPPEPTPPPAPTPTPTSRPRKLVNTFNPQSSSRPSLDAHGSATRNYASSSQSLPRLPSDSTRQTTSASPIPNLGRLTPYRQTQASYSASGLTQNPSSSHQKPNTHGYHPQPTSSATNPSSYNASMNSPALTAVQSASRARAGTSTTVSSAPHNPSSNATYQAPSSSHTNGTTFKRQPDVYVMSDAANSSVPVEIRSQFPCDDRGRVLWFTTPPVDGRSLDREIAVPPPPSSSSTISKNGGDRVTLSHSPAYFAAREKRRRLCEEKRERYGKQRQEEQEQLSLPPSSSPDQEAASPLRKRRKSAKPAPTTALDDDTTILLHFLNAHLNHHHHHHQSSYRPQSQHGQHESGNGNGNDVDNDNNDATIKFNTDARITAQAEMGQMDIDVDATTAASYDRMRAVQRQREYDEKMACFAAREEVARQKEEREGKEEGRVFKDDWDERY